MSDFDVVTGPSIPVSPEADPLPQPVPDVADAAPAAAAAPGKRR